MDTKPIKLSPAMKKVVKHLRKKRLLFFNPLQGGWFLDQDKVNAHTADALLERDIIETRVMTSSFIRYELSHLGKTIAI